MKAYKLVVTILFKKLTIFNYVELEAKLKHRVPNLVVNLQAITYQKVEVVKNLDVFCIR